MDNGGEEKKGVRIGEEQNANGCRFGPKEK